MSKNSNKLHFNSLSMFLGNSE